MEKEEKVYLKPVEVKLKHKTFRFTREEENILFQFFEYLEEIKFGELTLKKQDDKIFIGNYHKNFK